MKILIVSHDEVVRLLPMVECIGAMEEALAALARGEVHQPLRMVTSYTQMLARRYQGQLDQEADDFIGHAVDGAKRMQTLIEDLLAYSRVGTEAKEFAATDLNTVVADTLKDLCIADGRIVPDTEPHQSARTIDATGMIVMPGGVDVHTHVAGGALNFARGLVP